MKYILMAVFMVLAMPVWADNITCMQAGADGGHKIPCTQQQILDAQNIGQFSYNRCEGTPDQMSKCEQKLGIAPIDYNYYLLSTAYNGVVTYIPNLSEKKCNKILGEIKKLDGAALRSAECFR